MTPRRVLALVVLVGGFMSNSTQAQPPPIKPAPRRPVDADLVAAPTAPGTVVPGAIAFAPDGRAVTYLKSESDSLSRVLWKADVADGGRPRVVARPPGGGDTEANLSKEEALRRERQRLQNTGITQVVRAEAADVAVLPLGGDLFLFRGEGDLVRLTRTPSPEVDPKPSRDGTRIAFVRDGDLFVLDVATRAETRLTQGATDGLTHGLAEFIAQEELDRFTGFWWSPDGKWIAYQETDERHVPAFAITHQGGDEFSVETHRYPFAGRANAKVRLGVVSADGGPTRWLPLGEPVEDFYLARVDWDSPTTLLVQVLSRDQKRLRLQRVDAEEGRRTVLFEETSETWIDLHDDLRVVPGTGEILWSSERSGRRHLELYDRDGKLVRALTSGDWAVDPLSFHAGLRGVVALDPRRREVWFQANKEGPLESHLYRVSLDGGPVRRITREPGTHRVVVAPDGEHFVDVASSHRRPPVTTLRDRDGNVLATLDDAANDPRLADLDLTPPVLTEFPNRDGTTLYGAYYAPRSAPTGRKAPLIVMTYGGPTVQYVTDSWTLTADLTAQLLAARGFAVWKADNRGSIRRGKAFQTPVFRELGRVEVRDQVDGVRFVAGRWPEVDAGRVGVTGRSYGGFLTLRCLTDAPDVFRAGVSVAPVTDWDGYDTAYTERYLGRPDDHSGGYRRSSVLPRVSELKGDLLVIHGMLDENVHFRHAARLATALIAAGKPFQVLPLPDERHSSRRPAERKYVAERMAAFFEDALRHESP